MLLVCNCRSGGYQAACPRARQILYHVLGGRLLVCVACLAQGSCATDQRRSCSMFCLLKLSYFKAQNPGNWLYLTCGIVHELQQLSAQRHLPSPPPCNLCYTSKGCTVYSKLRSSVVDSNSFLPTIAPRRGIRLAPASATPWHPTSPPLSSTWAAALLQVWPIKRPRIVYPMQRRRTAAAEELPLFPEDQSTCDHVLQQGSVS